MSMQGTSASGHQDPTWGIIAGIGLVVCSPFILWLLAHEHISMVALFVCKLIFIGMAGTESFFSSFGINSLLYYIIPQKAFTDASNWIEVIPRINYKAIEFDDLMKALTPAGQALRIAFLPVMIFMLVKLFKRTRPARMTRRISLDHLTKINCIFFPQIKPAVLEKPMQQDPDHGSMAREASPIRFAILNKAAYVNEKSKFSQDDSPGMRRILTFDEALSDKPGYLVVEDDLDRMIKLIHNKIQIDTGVIKGVFEEQLGERWNGSDSLDPYVRALYAALIVQVCGDKKGAAQLLHKLNTSWTRNVSKKDGVTYLMDTKGIDKIISKNESNKLVQEVIEQHSYTTTVLSALLEAARAKGKLISPDFLWLKIHNRTLWYTLNQVGGQTGWSESAGPWAHYIAEKKIGHPLTEPFIDTAVAAFVQYLGDFEGWILGSADEVKSDDAGETAAA